MPKMGLTEAETPSMKPAPAPKAVDVDRHENSLPPIFYRPLSRLARLNSDGFDVCPARGRSQACNRTARHAPTRRAGVRPAARGQAGPISPGTSNCELRWRGPGAIAGRRRFHQGSWRKATSIPIRRRCTRRVPLPVEPWRSLPVRLVTPRASFGSLTASLGANEVGVWRKSIRSRRFLRRGNFDTRWSQPETGEAGRKPNMRRFSEPAREVSQDNRAMIADSSRWRKIGSSISKRSSLAISSITPIRLIDR